MSASLLTKAGVRPSTDAEAQALTDHLVHLYRQNEHARLAGNLEAIAFLQPAVFQQLMIAAPHLRNVLAPYLPQSR